jgi:hypothetical protein
VKLEYGLVERLMPSSEAGTSALENSLNADTGRTEAEEALSGTSSDFSDKISFRFLLIFGKVLTEENSKYLGK